MIKKYKDQSMKAKLVRNAFRLFFVLLIAFGLYSVKDQVFKTNNGEAWVDGRQSTEGFIAEIAGSAQSLAASNDLYASVIIAQAILESDSGNSELASQYYNIFGIKGYDENVVNMNTWEDDGSGNAYYIYDNFKTYSSYYGALVDYVNFIHAGYHSTYRSNTTSYLDATAALTGTYATDTSYGSKLNSLISRYNLTQYDVASSGTTADTSQMVYNSYRQKYTDAETLANDEAYAASSATY